MPELVLGIDITGIEKVKGKVTSVATVLESRLKNLSKRLESVVVNTSFPVKIENIEQSINQAAMLETKFNELRKNVAVNITDAGKLKSIGADLDVANKKLMNVRATVAKRIIPPKTIAEFRELEMLMKRNVITLDQFRSAAKRMDIGLQKSTGFLKEFKMELLGIMFFGMAMQRFFVGFLKEATMKFLDVTDRATALGKSVTELQANFAVLQLTLISDLEPALTVITEILSDLIFWFLGLPSPIRRVIGSLTLLGAALGVALFFIGTMGLGITSLMQFIGGTAAPAVAGLALSFDGVAVSSAAATTSTGGFVSTLTAAFVGLNASLVAIIALIVVLAAIWATDFMGFQDVFSDITKDAGSMFKNVKKAGGLFFDWLGIQFRDTSNESDETFDAMNKKGNLTFNMMLDTAKAAFIDFVSLLVRIVVLVPAYLLILVEKALNLLETTIIKSVLWLLESIKSILARSEYTVGFVPAIEEQINEARSLISGLEDTVRSSDLNFTKGVSEFSRGLDKATAAAKGQLAGLSTLEFLPDSPAKPKPIGGVSVGDMGVLKAIPNLNAEVLNKPTGGGAGGLGNKIIYYNPQTEINTNIEVKESIDDDRISEKFEEIIGLVLDKQNIL